MHPARTPLARALRRRLARRADLIPRGARVLVAWSGGRDSTVLLHLLRFGDVVDAEVHAAHFDHALRPVSAADAEWCRGVAHAWDVPLHERRTDRPLAGEADAREARYAFLERARRRSGADRILTAHHADDQAETVLFRLLRGSGWPGLAGIPECRDVIARPLLTFRRRRIRTYATAVGLRWREDASNTEPVYARNRIRTALTVLDGVRPGTSRALWRLGDAVREAEDRLAPLVAAATRVARIADGPAPVLARSVLLSYDPIVRARVMRNVLGRLGVSSGRAIRAADAFLPTARTGTSIDLPKGLLLERQFDRFVLRGVERMPADRPVVIRGPSGSGTARIGGRTFEVAWGAGAGEDAFLLPAEAIRTPLVLRGWQPGDRIRLAYGTKKLKKLFAERRLARAERFRVPVLADAAGRVLWIPGVAVSEDARAGAGTHLSLTVRH